MDEAKTKILTVGLMLALFAIGSTILVSVTELKTRDKIIANERQTLLTAINALVDSSEYDNDILTDILLIPSQQQLATKDVTKVYRARQDNSPIAAIFTSIAPNGYSGKIKLLVGVYSDGTLAGVRVIKHKETPGLGDKIDLKKTDWILQFKGLSLSKPKESQWKVKKDGGEFDQFTGATITPRAIVSAVQKALHYFQQNQGKLFEEVTQ